MRDDATEFGRLIARLDHPDAGIQDRVLDTLSERPEQARSAVLSALMETNARVRRALLRWLDDHLDGEATLPLMRYTFDTRESFDEQTGRSMAMGLLFRRARSTETPEERGRLRAFAEDMAEDSNPDVRRVAMRILAFTGNDGSVSAVEPRTEDDDEDVRSAARETLEVLRKARRHTDGADSQHESPDELRARLLQSAGPLRRQLVRQWRRHPRRAEIAVDIVEQGQRLRAEALRILLDDPDLRVRPRLAEMVSETPDGELAPLALRLMAKVVDEEPGDDEIAAVRRGLHSDSVLTRAAACRAAGALGLTDCVGQLIRASQSRDLPVALDAARSLEQLLDDSHHELLQRLLTAVKTAERRRRRHPDQPDFARVVAHLLAGIAAAVSPATIGVEALHRTTLDILADGQAGRPLGVTALQVLMASTPDEGLEKFDRWDERDASALLGWLEGADEPMVRRIGEVLLRAAPRGMEGLDEAARRIWERGDVSVADIVVPLLDRADTSRAVDWLESIADGGEQPATTAASRVLRRRRNDREFIDVEFIPRDDDR